jgi:hypothetical protein
LKQTETERERERERERKRVGFNNKKIRYNEGIIYY